MIHTVITIKHLALAVMEHVIMMQKYNSIGLAWHGRPTALRKPSSRWVFLSTTLFSDASLVNLSVD